MIKFIIIFSICSLVNVMLNTIKTIIMYNNNKLSSSLINAVTYGFYTVVVVLMAGDMALWLKVIITTITNFIGVWLSMVILERLRKDKLWKIEVVVNYDNLRNVENILTTSAIPYNTINTSNQNQYIINIYCATQKESIAVRTLIDKYNIKYFVSETKTL